MTSWPVQEPGSRRRGMPANLPEQAPLAWNRRPVLTRAVPVVLVAPKPPRRSRHLRRAADFAGVLAALGLLWLALDFAGFVAEVTARPPADLHAADGIVALTGGSDRISEAFDLLAEGMGKRLLITGVNLATSDNALSAGSGTEAAGLMMRCCVDLDRNALNTVGNAIEAARWVHDQKFRSVIVVTSNYHMPRSLLELRRALPDTELLAYPVAGQNLHLDHWWQEPASLRLVFSEYLKYLGARVKLRLEPATLAALSDQRS